MNLRRFPLADQAQGPLRLTEEFRRPVWRDGDDVLLDAQAFDKREGGTGLWVLPGG